MAIFCDRKFCEYNNALEKDEELHKFQTEDIRYCISGEICVDKKGKCLTYKRKDK